MAAVTDPGVICLQVKRDGFICNAGFIGARSAESMMVRCNESRRAGFVWHFGAQGDGRDECRLCPPITSQPRRREPV
jgi:hypothetical protein